MMADVNRTLFVSDVNETSMQPDCPNFANLSDPEDVNSDFPSYVEYVCYPFLLLICTIGNVLVITVFSSRRHATSVAVYLTVLALADLGVL